MKRSCGILLHLSSLPSPHGIGTMGKAAFEFIDFLSGAKQGFWQMLPVSPTSFADSPYQSVSTFAGNPYFIDLDILVNEGLLLPEELNADWGDDPRKVDYGKLYLNRGRVLRLAFSRFDRNEMEDFVRENAAWLDGYSLFAACKEYFSGLPWHSWDDEIKFRTPEGLEKYRTLLAEDIAYHRFVQYEFDKQWSALRAYAKGKGVKLIGDVPIYVPWDSADVWERPELYLLDEELKPVLVAGVPPDYFSKTGQLWGNPLYDWDAHEREGFAWWLFRMGAAKRRFDVARIDHFRGLESFWAVPFAEETAVNGSWLKGPGMKLVSAIKREHPDLTVIAEDLGFLTPEVNKLLSDSGFWGMRVLQFGFDPYKNSRELPHNYPLNCVAYTGTHDNSTMMGWASATEPKYLGFAVQYLGLNREEGFPFGFARGVLCSCAKLAIIPMQDYLGLGDEARMNLPGSTGWWTYRMGADDCDEKLQSRIASYSRMTGRAD
ncbi:MAG: 4-alpha-glucanotransferase [Clostridia bacterium]|nr:4-alpha-glucanotransferase [Clostridia bacterium]